MIPFPPRRVRSALAALAERPARSAFLLQSERFRRAQGAVSIFYLLQFVLLVEFINRWPLWRQAISLAPVGIAAWMPGVGIPLSIDLTLSAYGIALVLACLAPHVRFFRSLVFVTLLLAAGLSNSFGKIDHGYHCWIYVSFALIFLSAERTSEDSSTRLSRQKFLTVVMAAQALVLGSYTLSGLWKSCSTVLQALSQQKSYLSLDGFAYQVAGHLLETASTTVLGPIFIENPWLGWLPMLVATYVEFFALAVLFRPSLPRTWGFLLIGLHLGAGLAMGITFVQNILLLALLFGASPFSVQPVALRYKLSSLLCLVGRWQRRWGGRNKHRCLGRIEQAAYAPTLSRRPCRGRILLQVSEGMGTARPAADRARSGNPARLDSGLSNLC